MAKVQPMIMACESRAHNDNDRHLFVANLGTLLSQTREGIVGAYLDDRDQVHVVYKDGYARVVDVSCDSYMAIIRDVTRRL